MQKSIELQAKEEVKELMQDEVVEVSEKVKFSVMYAFGVIVLLSAFIFNTPSEIFKGLINITIDPSILVSDYMEIGNIGAAFFNGGLLMLISIMIVSKSKVKMTGTTMAAIFTVCGFALFGKNIYNIWSIFLGVFLYSRYSRQNFGKYILPALFGTGLSPIVSQVSFGLGLTGITGILAGNLFGVIVGFVVPSLAVHFVKFHQGFNLYNMGFTCGIVGTFFMAIFRGFGFENEKRLFILEGHNQILGICLSMFFISMLIVGIYLNKKSLNGYGRLLKQTGRSVQDFVLLNGFGVTLINMAIVGFIATAYVILVKGQLNGPVIGGIFTVVGFGAFGKHTKNIIPVMIGVFLASYLMTWNVNATGAVLAALFGTSLAPIAGQFGWKAGVLAGFIHMAVVMNVGYLHGGMNLYNNGFAAGLVAATVVPILEALRREA